MFEIGESELKMVQETKFKEVRLEVCQQAQMYNTVIAPMGQSVLQDTSNFFTGFVETYEDLDTLKEFIEDVCNDALLIVQGFEICKKIHEPMLTAADLNKLKAKTVQDEIGIKFESLTDDYQAIIDKVNDLNV